VPAAASVELVRNHSLVHDDVMDGDATRRHRLTAWAVFGTNPAIQAGDALLSLAFGVLVASGHPDALRAGASAPPTLVDEVVAGLAGLGPIRVEERVVAEENVRFTVPGKAVRR
jgi:geranylgeranyl diphosphate synthase type I